MEEFEEISDLPVEEYEKNIADFWEDINVLEKSIQNRDENEAFVFYEGPPTANGKPGIHHVIARALKDAVCRYKTMKGYQVKRKAGWDTHGLPVEIEVEKELDLNNKQEIEEYGIDNFNEKCRESVFEYENLWREMTQRMGYAIDLDNPYITLENDYIETIWWILDKFHQEDLIYEGHKILPYCPRCGTGLASHEVAQGYEEITSISVTVKFKRKDKDEYFLSWTTTPWTLAANVALTVHPDMNYLRVEAENGEIYYVEATLADEVLEGDYKVLDTYKGKELEGIEYEQLMPFTDPEKDAFYITVNDYVTAEEGTGIVHTAPAFGEDDYQTGRKYDLPVVQPVNEDGKYTTTPWEGEFVMDSDLEVEILKWLYNNDKLYKKEKMTHNYPHCWRCGTPLIYYAKPSWYIEMTQLKDKLIENNNSVKWYPDFVGEKRFGNWLENLQDWALSRTRYWGTPLNIWTCECGNKTSIASRQELKERAIEDIDEDIELHRPYVDEVHIKCEECGQKMTRDESVIDCWFDSGSMPFAQLHYPFENEEEFEERFPADFICEGIDQTRGWFYSLLAISTFITGKSPYKRVLVNDLILDKNGKKMSKSKGNTVDPFELFEEYGADNLRWYLLYVSPPWTPTRFDIEGLQETNSKFYSTIKNVYHFFSLYANTDEVNPEEFFVDYKNRTKLDKWILSKYHNLLETIEKNMDEYDLTKTVRNIQDFIDEDLSNWYIRRSRRRFWASELDQDKKAVYNTTFEILKGLARAIAPFAPFIAEDLYKKLTDELSVHLADYPEINPELINNELEEKMDLTRTLVTLGRASREKEELKVRQPISKVILDSENKELVQELIPLIKEELNVKEVEFTEDIDQFMEYNIKPNYEVVGPELRSQVGLFEEKLNQLDASDIAPRLQAGATITVDLDGKEYEVTEEKVNINISSKEGFTIGMENELFVVLDIELTQDLKDEGYAREFISKVQQMRKNKDFNVTDNINIYYNGDEEIKNAVSNYKDYIKEETLAINIKETENEMEIFDLNGHETGIEVERINN